MKMPIRRRTFFGQTGDPQLEQIVMERKGSDVGIANILSAAKWYEVDPDIPAELMQQNCTDREMRMAAKAELQRRQERQERGGERRRRW